MIAWIALCLLLITGGGCSQEQEVAVSVYPVDGVLLVSGKPATGAILTFHPIPIREDAHSLIATGIVRDDGHFLPTLPDGRIGLAEGQYALTAVWNDGSADRFQGKYSDVKNPIQQITVKTGLNLLPPIKIQ